MHDLVHQTVGVNNIRSHYVACGEGPLVILVHGFPESWYSWRYQLSAIADAGFRAVAIDVRGYGRSSKPTAVADYSMMQNVGDIVALIDALGDAVGDGKATLIGHDWGAPIVWNTALLRGDVVRGVAGLSVPFSAPGAGATRPTDGMRAMAGEANEFYIEYFQSVGRAEAEIEQNVRDWLLGFYHCASADIKDGPNISLVERGKQLRDKLVLPETMPEWLTTEDLDHYTSEFEYSGFFGPLCRYRNVDRDWAELKAYVGKAITVPSLFIGGSRDGPTMWGGAAIAQFEKTLSALTKSVIIEGSGHWIQQEYATATNAELLEFLTAIH